jgi:hypothetical protein
VAGGVQGAVVLNQLAFMLGVQFEHRAVGVHQALLDV